MKIGKAEFPAIWKASGATNFFDEGYWFHWILALVGMNWRHVCFVAKTTPFYPKAGNMPLAEDGITPLERRPACIYMGLRQWWHGVMLNAVGLSSVGFEKLLAMGKWQKMTQPFILSFMAVGQTVEERMLEVAAFVHTLLRQLHTFRAEIALQYNRSCPNVGAVKVSSAEFVKETLQHLDLLAKLGIPIFIKLCVTTSTEDARAIAAHSACSGIVISNTIPWGQLPDRIEWKRLFGTEVSPLAHLGGGGLSGAPLLPLVVEWVTKIRKEGYYGHINAGGGILHKRDVVALKEAGANSISLGTIGILRPWRMIDVIWEAQKQFEGCV